jgi:hypothetical protein
MSETQPNFLDPIVGEYLSSVCFVLDYIQLDFNGKTLTAYNPIAVSAEYRCINGNHAGWRDAICARIGRHVLSAICTDDEIRIGFEDESTISLSLRDEDYVGPEAFQFQAPEKPLVVG